MAVIVFLIYIVVVVLPVGGSRVVGRVDIDAIDLALIRMKEQLESVVILALDHHVVRCIRVAAFHGAEVFKSRVDRFPEARNQGQFRNFNFFNTFSVI